MNEQSNLRTYDYGQISFEKGFLKPTYYTNRRIRQGLQTENSFAPANEMIFEDAHQIFFSMEQNGGKLTDAGYDKFLFCCAKVPLLCDVTFSARINVLSFLNKEPITYQEAFGLIIRDTMELNPKTGHPLSNMALVGGCLGRLNFYVRTGIEKNNADALHNYYLHEKTRNTEDFKIRPEDPRRFNMRLSFKKNGIYASMRDESGKDMLMTVSERENREDFLCAKDSEVFFPLQKEQFSKQEQKYIYVGFFAAGADIAVDKDSVRLEIDEENNETKKESCLYASAEGDCHGDGSENAPFDLQTAIRCLQDGQTLIVQPGHYKPVGDIVVRKKESGRRGKEKRIVCPKAGAAVIDFEGKDAGFLVEGDYWNISGLSVTRGLGFRIQGSHNHVKDCTAKANLETGFLIRHKKNDSPKREWPCFNSIEDCTSFENRDIHECNADGFACKIAAGAGNRFVRCLSFLNSDDGFDLFSKNRKIGRVKLRSCQSFLNGFKRNESGELLPTNGNGNGFKLGGSGMGILHKVISCEAFGNRGTGFTSNSNPQIELIRCSAGSNGSKNIQFYYSGAKAIKAKIIWNFVQAPDEEFDRARWLKETYQKILKTPAADAEVLEKGQ